MGLPYLKFKDKCTQGVKGLSNFIREVSKDPEGGLIPDRYKRVFDMRIFKYSLIFLVFSVPVSKIIYRLSKVSWIKFPDEVVLLAVLLIIISYMILVVKLGIMTKAFMDMDDDEYAKMGAVAAGRLALQGVKVATGGLIAFGGVIKGLDTYGNMKGKGPIGTNAGITMFKKLGLYEGNYTYPQPKGYGNRPLIYKVQNPDQTAEKLLGDYIDRLNKSNIDLGNSKSKK